MASTPSCETVRRDVSTLALAMVMVLFSTAAAAAAYEAVDVKDGGSLTGVVRFAGAPPKLAPLPVNKNREICGEEKASEALVVGADGGVRGSVVLLEGVTHGKKP